MKERETNVDPQEFGGVKAKTDSAHARIDKIDTKLETIDQKIDKMKWIVVAALLLSPILNDVVPSGTEVLLVIKDKLNTFVEITYANL